MFGRLHGLKILYRIVYSKFKYYMGSVENEGLEQIE